MSALTEEQAVELVACAHCGPKPMSEFRVFTDAPPIRFYDFCNECSNSIGLPRLYDQHRVGVDQAVAASVLKDNGESLKKKDDISARQQELIRRDLADRELARRHLIPFVRRFMPNYHADWVHHDMAARLEKFVAQIERGESPRLILAIPPRHGKSILGSDNLPSWVLGKHPEWEVIAASHSIDLSLKFSRNIRDRVKDPSFAAVFPDCTIRGDNAGAGEWRTTTGGGYRAAGVGTGILGMGAHVLIIDDPFPDAEAAYSETRRATVMDWFNTTAMTRLAPGGGALIIAQRWHDMDLTGQVIALRKALIEEGAEPDEIDDWEVVNYPAIAEGDEYLMPDGSIAVDPLVVDGARKLRNKGEALHPHRYDLPRLNRIKSRMPPSQWNALFQQNPVPDDGDFFSKDMFRYEPMLDGTRDEYVFLTAWDVAIGEKRRNDWSVGVVVAADKHNNMHVVDMVRGRFGTIELVNAACDLIQKWDCLQFGMEHGQIKMTLWPLIVEEMRRRKITCGISEELKPITDKETRATPLRGMMQTGRVFFPHRVNAPWVETAVGEMLRFPLGAHDDIVDALAWATRLFQKAPKPLIVARDELRGERPWRDRLSEFGVSDGSRGGCSHMAN